MSAEEQDESLKEDKNSTTITFRIKNKEKNKWQFAANLLTEGNITHLIKKALNFYVSEKFGSWDIMLNNNDIHQYYWNLSKQAAQSDDPNVIRATWDSQKPRLMKYTIEGYQLKIKQLNEWLEKELNTLMNFQL